MVNARTLALALTALLAVAAASPLTSVRVRRQLADDNTLQPIEDGITYRRQVRSTSPERVSLLLTSDTSPFNTGATLNKGVTLNKGATSNQGIGSNLNAWSQDSNTGATSATQDTLLNTRGLSTNSERGARQADDIPVFDRNKVSLDFPGALFGPSLSLLIKTTKIVGDVIQNSAVRYQSFLRLFRPLFRGQFEIKGLDPPTTTTTTTTTTTKAPVAADNEVRRR